MGDPDMRTYGKACAMTQESGHEVSADHSAAGPQRLMSFDVHGLHVPGDGFDGRFV